MYTTGHLTQTQLDALQPGQRVLAELGRPGTQGMEYAWRTVARRTATQLVVTYQLRGEQQEERYRQQAPGRRVGDGASSGYQAYLVDPEHPSIQKRLADQEKKRAQRRVDVRHTAWQKEPASPVALQQLREALDAYAAAYLPQDGAGQ